MRNFIIGVLFGFIMAAGVAYAANRIVLQSGSGVEIGTSANPLYITTP